MKITIITSCTGQKKYHPEDQLQRSDFEQLHQPEVFRQLEARLKDYQTPARDLYAGQQHLRLMEGWRHLDTQDGDSGVAAGPLRGIALLSKGIVIIIGLTMLLVG